MRCLLTVRTRRFSAIRVLMARWLRSLPEFPVGWSTRSSRSARAARPRLARNTCGLGLLLEPLECRLVPSGLTLSPSALPADTINVPYNTFYANQVVSYVPGTLADPSYDNPSAALGGLNPVAASFAGTNYYLTPFDPAFGPSNLVEIGAGGSLILKLAQPAATNGYTIGVHTGFGLLDAAYPGGVNANPASYINSWLRQADVMVSADGVNWGNLGTITFDNPSNIDTGAATDPEGGSPGVGPAANPGEPFLGSLSSFNGENWQQTLATLNGSAGGTWLNLSGVTDENGNAISQVNYIEFVVPSNPPLDPNTGNPELMMVDAVVGTNTAGTIAASGGTGAVTLTVSNVQNAIPGLIVPSSGTGSLAITGTPAATGTETFTVTATDALGDATTTNYSITVNPAVTLGSLPVTGTAGVAYSNNITVSGGTGNVSLAVSNIEDPLAGLNIPRSGVNGLTISGTPTQAGTVSFTVTATDAAGAVTTQNYAIAVAPASSLTLSPLTLTAGAVGSKYSATLTASDGFGDYAFTVAKGSKLPPGLTLESDGGLEGTPTAAGRYTFTVTAEDSSTPTLTGTATYTVTITPALVVSAATLPTATVGDSYSFQLTATGGSGSGYTFSASNLPAGLTLSAGGMLTGTPDTTNASPLQVTMAVTVTDSNQASSTRNLTLTVDPVLDIGPPTLPVATAGTRFSQQFTATGGSGRGYIFTATSLPAGLTVSESGLLSGTPTTAATSITTANIVVKVTDSQRGTTTEDSTLTIDPALTLAPTTLPAATVGNPFDVALTASGGVGSGYTITAKGLPSWLTLSGQALLGTPTTAGAAQFTVAVTDAIGATATHVYTVHVNPAIVVHPATLTATFGDTFRMQLSATGGSGRGYTFAAADLPSWLTLTPAGLLSGTPASTAPAMFTVTATDSNGATGSCTYAMAVDPAITVSLNAATVLTVGDRFSTPLAASGGTGTGYVFTATGLPAWLTLSSTGLLSGTPPTAAAGSTPTIEVTATDSVKGTGTASFTLNVDPALTLDPLTLPPATVGNLFSMPLTVTGGTGSGYTLTARGLPSWLTLSGNTLTGTPPTATPVRFAIDIADSIGATGSEVYTLIVNPAIVVHPATLTATLGDPFRVQLSATGGSGKGYTFSMPLMAGFTLTSTGLLTGMPTSSVTLTVTVSDSNGATGSRTYTLTVDPALAINPRVLGAATVGNRFATQMTASGGSGVGYRFSASGLPTWLTMSAAGLLSGTPPASATPVSFTVTVTDSQGGYGTMAYTLTVDPALQLTPTTLSAASATMPYFELITASGGSGSGYVFRAVGLPVWLNLSNTGVLSGIPPATAGGTSVHFSVIVTDSQGGEASRTYTLAVQKAG